MKVFILTIVSIFLISIGSCKKKEPSDPIIIEPTTYTIVNLSEEEDYRVLSTYTAGSLLLKRGESSKVYQIQNSVVNEALEKYKSLHIAIALVKQSYVDTAVLNFSIIPHKENIIFIKDPDVVVSMYDCDKPRDNTRFRFLNLYGIPFFRVLDPLNNISNEYYQASTPDPYNPPVNIGSCISLKEGKYTLQFFKDTTNQTPFHAETDFITEQNRTYYFYLNSKNEFKWFTL